MHLMQQFKTLTGSTFADSMRTLAGTPSAMVFQDRGKGTLGEYNGPRILGGGAHEGPALNQDTLYLTPELFNGHPVGQAPDSDPAKYHRQPEYAFAHEMGHRREAAELAQGDFTLAHKLQAVQDSVESDAFNHHRSDPVAYWNTNGAEHYAEAFANAVTFLRHTAAQRADLGLPQRVAPLMAQADSVVPGTRLMIQKLLAHPLYAQHPLNQINTPALTSPDAVRLFNGAAKIIPPASR